jgi:hypothetical protein
MLLPPGLEPYAHVPVPEAPLSPKFHVNVTSCVTLRAAAESLVAVASKNTSSGDIPVARTTCALSCKLPICDIHVGPAVVVPDPALDELELDELELEELELEELELEELELDELELEELELEELELEELELLDEDELDEGELEEDLPLEAGSEPEPELVRSCPHGPTGRICLLSVLLLSLATEEAGVPSDEPLPPQALSSVVSAHARMSRCGRK